MKYKLGKTKAIHWDQDSIYKITGNGIIQWIVTADVFSVYEGQLPVILVANPTILENDIAVWSAIFHTKAFLLFNPIEEPINDIIKMWNECYLLETSKFKELGKGTILEYFQLDKLNNSMFNSAYHLRDAAIERKLVTIPQAPL